jgi:two-component system response regulator AtoC
MNTPQQPIKVLWVDDEPHVRFAVSEVLEAAGFAVFSEGSVEAALPHLADVEVIVSDLSMPGKDGLTFLDELARQRLEVPLIILTARGNERTAVAAMKRGAWDYLSKPFDNEELVLSVRRAAERFALNQSHQRRAAQNHLGQWIVGESPAFSNLLSKVQRIAPREVSVLLHGETGTGKEAIASLIHAHSARRDKPLVRFNCAAIAESVAAAELFGHEKGAFTGAVQRRPGFFGRADGGTLVLDEVAELPLGIQSSLLRVLQQGEIQPVGASRVEKVDVRVVACSAVDLAQRVDEGRFRADLYYRLKVVELRVPPLRERTSDIALLVRHFQVKYAERFGLNDVPFPESLVSALALRPWPGNIRELENHVAHLLALSDDGHVSELPEQRLPHATTPHANSTLPPETARAATAVDGGSTLRALVTNYERQLIEAALAESGNNQSQAARALGTTRTTLIDKMKRLGIGH